jgi:hypothetical protein
VVVSLNGSNSALGNLLEGAGLLGRGLGRGAAAVAGIGGGGRDDSVGPLGSDESKGDHCEVGCCGLRSDVVDVGDLEDDLEDWICLID